MPDTTTIVSSIQLRGKKTGPDASRLSFGVNGVDNGRVRLIVFIDGNQALHHTVTIGNGIPSGQATTAPPSPTVVPLSAGVTPTPTPAGTRPLQTFFSVDRAASLTVQGVEYAGLVPVTATGVPTNWILVSDAYTIAPDSLVFSPAATISFLIPGQRTAPAYFIGRYQNRQWVIVPGTAQDTAIVVAIDSAGTYALMAYKTAGTVPAAAPAQPTVSAGTPTFNGTRTNVPVTQETSPAATKTPLSALPVFCALAIGVGMVTRNRK